MTASAPPKPATPPTSRSPPPATTPSSPRPSPWRATAKKPPAHTEVYRYDAPAEKLACVSCNPTGEPSAGDASLASNGLSLTDEGRVFFNSTDRLAVADTDERQDVYEWEPLGAGNCGKSSPSFYKATGACLALVSAGTSTFDSGLLGADANGTDVYFFTRDSLAPQDKNGPTMKIYDAREGGGFPYEFPPSPARPPTSATAPPAPPPRRSKWAANPAPPTKPNRNPRTARRASS